MPKPMTTALLSPVTAEFEKNAGDLAAVDQDVIRPFQAQYSVRAKGDCGDRIAGSERCNEGEVGERAGGRRINE